MLDTYKYKGRIKCPVCSKDAPSVGLCPSCGCSTDVRTSPPVGDVVACEGLTTDKLRTISKELEKCAMKPYKGFFGFGPNGLFEIKTEQEYQSLISPESAGIE